MIHGDYATCWMAWNQQLLHGRRTCIASPWDKHTENNLWLCNGKIDWHKFVTLQSYWFVYLAAATLQVVSTVAINWLGIIIFASLFWKAELLLPSPQTIICRPHGHFSLRFRLWKSTTSTFGSQLGLCCFLVCILPNNAYSNLAESYHTAESWRYGYSARKHHVATQWIECTTSGGNLLPTWMHRYHRTTTILWCQTVRTCWQ